MRTRLKGIPEMYVSGFGIIEPSKYIEIGLIQLEDNWFSWDCLRS